VNKDKIINVSIAHIYIYIQYIYFMPINYILNILTAVYSAKQ